MEGENVSTEYKAVDQPVEKTREQLIGSTSADAICREINLNPDVRLEVALKERSRK